jgi:hypothetical protein
MDDKKLGQEPAYPFFKWNEAGFGDAICIYLPNGNMQIINYDPGMSKRLKTACSVGEDFDNWSRRLQEEIVGEPCPDVDKHPKEFVSWYIKGRTILRYMQADELLKQENL